jgi:DNA-directed RNA polymerase specialized sigma subunit
VEINFYSQKFTRSNQRTSKRISIIKQNVKKYGEAIMTSNKYDHIDDYLELRLNEWAEWLSSGNTLGIGYPKQSIISLIREGVVISRKNNNNCSVLEVNEQVEEIEKLISEMSDYKPIMAKCLRMYYLDNLSLRSNAKKLEISYSQFKLNVLMAKQWLVGRLGRIFAIN